MHLDPRQARRRMARAAVATIATVVLSLSCAHAPPPPVTFEHVAALTVPPADHRIAYGSDPQQFGDLRLPDGPGPFPVVLVVHGGCWRAEYDVGHIGPLAEALTKKGWATWAIEYRRVGNAGGGWPGTFEDVARAADHLRELAKQYPLDLERVVAVGHSAGGHLALWLAARPGFRAGAPGASAAPLELRGVVGLAAITDLAEYARGSSFCMRAAAQLMGGPPDSLPDLYAQASPIALLPANVPVLLLHGDGDKVVPLEQSLAFERAGKGGPRPARVRTLAGAGHFDLIAPDAPVFRDVERAIRELLERR